MHVFALQAVADSGGQIESVARTFGVDWTHLGAQSVSFAIVCAILYAFAYTPILKMLEARREQIKLGIANAAKIQAELARIEVERHEVLQKAGEQGKALIEDARQAAAVVKAEATAEGGARGRRDPARAHENAERERARMLDEVKHEVGRLVMAHDGVGDRQDPDGRRPAAPGRGDGKPARAVARARLEVAHAIRRRKPGGPRASCSSCARPAASWTRRACGMIAGRLAASPRRGAIQALDGVPAARCGSTARATRRVSRARRRSATTSARRSWPQLARRDTARRWRPPSGRTPP